jgi:tRNA(Ile)-lysidine synthase
VVAVSGGGDSVALLRLLQQAAQRLSLRLSVAHLDHSLRGEASRADAVFVAELADQLGLPCDLGQWRPARAAHFESEARRARYHWLAEIAHARGASIVAAAHTCDDQAETILHRIVRGTGVRGLAGIPWRRRLGTEPTVTLVRPLLDVSRRALRDYLAELGQAFHEDQSNADIARTRARIRHDLMPKLETEYNPRAAQALVRLGAQAAALHRCLAVDVEELERAAVVSRSPVEVVVEKAFLRSVPLYLRCEVLRRIWRRAGWPEQGMTARRWLRLAALLRHDQSPNSMIGAGVVASSKGFFLVLRRGSGKRG